MKATRFIRKYFATGFVTVLMILFVFPLVWMALLSTQTRQAVFRFPPPILPGTALADNFRGLLAQIPYFQNLWNSFYIAALNTLLILFACSLAAYGFARFKRAPGNKILFYIVLGSLMVPPLAGIVPWFLLISKFGWVNSHWALIIPPAANAFGVFWMYQFIQQAVPHDLYEAAKIDGASDIRVYWQVVLPLIKPGLGALAVLSFLNSWQNFQMPLIVLTSTEKFTVPLALSNLAGMYGTDIPGTMLGTTISIIPIFIAFLFGTRYFIAGLTQGAVKS